MAENKEEVKKGKFQKGDRSNRPRKDKVDNSGLDKKLINVNRVSKTVKGGRKMRFAALVAVGDGKGQIGIALGKANEPTQAIEKATNVAKRELKKVALTGNTIPHEIIGKYGATSILMIPAPEGTGVIAGGAARTIFELCGVKDIVTKIHGSSNRINVVKATMNGLLALKTCEEIALRRGKNVEEI